MLKGALHRLGPLALFFAPFVVIAGLFAASDAVNMRQLTATREENLLLVRNMLASVELVTRMSREIDRTRLLVDAHIFEKGTVEMAGIEQQLASTGSDFATDRREYDPIATLPGEAATWQKLQREVAGLDAPLEQALALSRRNRDAEARQALLMLEPSFSAIDEDVTGLVSINRAGAEATVERVRALQHLSSTRTRTLGLLGIALSLGIGAVTTGLLRQRQARIERSSAILEERNRDLDAFAGRVAHDLRGPLGAVSLGVQRLARLAPAETAIVALLRRTLARMDAIVGGLLALSRSESAPDAVCDPAVAAADVTEDLAPRAQEEHVALRVEVEPARVRCLEPLLRQALFNLADNAMKYRRADIPAAVEIEGRALDDTYELSVRDNGTGMSPEDARRAFDPFFRAQRAQNHPGTGLGLSIVKRVIEGSGGTITVDSHLGRGTTFRTRLLLADEAPSHAAS